MSKFKIGDNVKIINPNNLPNSSKYALSASLLGKEGIIESVITMPDRVIYQFANVHIDEECLEIV